MLSSFGNLLPGNHDPDGLRRKSNYLSGKTGSGQIDDLYIGWFVGFLEQEDNVYFFGANIQGANLEAKGPQAKEIVLNILQEFELLP